MAAIAGASLLATACGDGWSVQAGGGAPAVSAAGPSDGAIAGEESNAEAGERTPPTKSRAQLKADLKDTARRLLELKRDPSMPFDPGRALRMLYVSEFRDDADVKWLILKAEELAGPEVVRQAQLAALDTVRVLEPTIIGPTGGVIQLVLEGKIPDEKLKETTTTDPELITCSNSPVIEKTDSKQATCWLAEPRGPGPVPEEADQPKIQLALLKRFERRRHIARLTIPEDLAPGIYRIDLGMGSDDSNTVCILDECKLWFEKRSSPILPVLAILFGRGEPSEVELENLTSREEELISAFKEVMKQQSHCRVEIVGSADSCRFEGGNDALSARRAFALRDELLKPLPSDEKSASGASPPENQADGEQGESVPEPWELVRFVIKAQGDKALVDLGLVDHHDRYARVATARLIDEEGKDCEPIDAVRLSPYRSRPVDMTASTQLNSAAFPTGAAIE